MLSRKLDMLGKVQAAPVRKIPMMNFLDSENEIVDGDGTLSRVMWMMMW